MRKDVWILYIGLVVLSVMYFRFWSRRQQKYTWIDSAVQGNGFAAFWSSVLFLWVLPEFGHLQAIYPGPGTFISLVIAVADSGVMQRRLPKPQRIRKPKAK